MMRIAYFGRLAEIAGTRFEEVAPPADVVDIRSLRSWLGAEGRTGLADASRNRALVDDEVVPEDFSLEGVGDVAFLPPMSGG